MFAKMKSFIAESKSIVASLVLGVVAGSLALGSSVHAAVDPEVASSTSLVVTTLKDNVSGVISANISNIVIVGVIIFSIGFVWKLARRFMK